MTADVGQLVTHARHRKCKNNSTWMLSLDTMTYGHDPLLQTCPFTFRFGPSNDGPFNYYCCSRRGSKECGSKAGVRSENNEFVEKGMWDDR